MEMRQLMRQHCLVLDRVVTRLERADEVRQLCIAEPLVIRSVPRKVMSAL